jgi:hypothetical protein
MSPLMRKRVRSSGVFVLLTVFLVPVVAGCGRSDAPPTAPKIRIEGTPGTSFGYSVSYFDGDDNVDSTGKGKTIPESGVYADDLKVGHQGVMVQVIPSGTANVTVILLDGSKELQRATATGNQETAEVRAGKINAAGPFRPK